MAFDKEKYWANRRNGKRGQGEVPAPSAPPSEVKSSDLPSNAVVSFGNDGKLVVKNRAYRRQTVSLFKKSSQLRKKKKRK